MQAKFEISQSVSGFLNMLQDKSKIILSAKAKLIFLPFMIILCRTVFSAYVSIKTKYKSYLNAEQGDSVKPVQNPTRYS